MDVFEKIAALQMGKEGTAPWMVGEQLKDICRREPECAELVEKDLDVKGMGLEDCEKKIKAYADGHKKGNCAVVPPNVAEAKAVEEVRRELQAKLQAAESEAKAAQQKLEAMQKEAKLQNPDAAVFKTLFDQVQADFDKLVKQLQKITGEDPAAGERLKGAVNALLDSFRAKVER